jgi:hypothetical protein
MIKSSTCLIYRWRSHSPCNNRYYTPHDLDDTIITINIQRAQTENSHNKVMHACSGNNLDSKILYNKVVYSIGISNRHFNTGNILLYKIVS